MSMRKRTWRGTPAATLAAVVLAAVLAAGCSDDGGDDSVLEFELSVDLEAASEVERCLLFRGPEVETFVIGGSHTYTPGSHHMLLFRTDLTEIPAELAGVRDCREEGKGLMSHIRGIAYGSQEATGEVHYPAGVGLPLRANEVLLMQAHYLNASDAKLNAKVSVRLDTAPPESIQQRAGTFFFYDPVIHVPGNSSAMASMSCGVRSEVTLLGASSHMHRRGVGYRAFLDGASAPAAQPFYTSDSWDHPGTLAAPMTIGAGSTIRFECDYMNTDAAEFIQGPSANSNEMCMFVGVYYPALEMADEFCLNGPHVFGTGDKTCSETVSCVQGCPAGTAPKRPMSVNDFTGAISFHECWQKCFAASCPKAWAPMQRNFDCIRGKCGAECMTTGSPDCQSCVVNNCLEEYGGCSNATCQ